jgi:hypothetical protein
LQVDNDLAAVAEGERDHATHALVVDVRIGIVIEAIALLLQRTQEQFGTVEKFEISHAG